MVATDPQVTGERIDFRTGHGRMLHGTLFRGHAADQRAVLFLGALAAPQVYLRHTAAWLASQGYGVLTFDYRGVGASAVSGDPSTNLDDWGEDTCAALRALRRACAPRRVLVVGHSLGGMLLGHSGVGGDVDGALLLAASQGRPAFYHGVARLRIEAAYRLLPPLARRLGGLPGWSFLLRAQVPRDVIVQWTRWGKKGRFARWDGSPSAPAFAAMRGPLIGVAIDDDDYAPCAAVDALLTQFTSAGVRRELLRPSDHGLAAIGHFGMFHSQAPRWTRELLLRWLGELEAL